MRCLSLAVVLVTACGDPVKDSPPDALGPFDPHVAAQDVSLLYPLTATTNRDELVNANETGPLGQLLPEQIVAGSPYPLDVNGGNYADMRLVSVRLDPCSARGGCSPEVRAIYQPIVTSATGTAAADGAVHVFYAVPSGELLEMVEEILALKHAFGSDVTYGDKLGPQPILVATGLGGDFARGLHAVLLRHLGDQRIERVTFLRHIFPDEHAWQFVAFEPVAGTFVVRTIVNTQTTQQVVFGQTALEDVLGGIRPDSQSTPTLPDVGTLAWYGRPAEVTPAIANGFAQAIAAQHPLMHNSEDTDCGTCHVAEGAHRAGGDIYDLATTGQFSSTRSVDYVRDGRAITNLHAFGYVGTSVSVMQRTANETALAADRLQALLPPAN